MLQNPVNNEIIYHINWCFPPLHQYLLAFFYTPKSLTWNLKIMVSKRNLLFQWLIFRRTMLNFSGVSQYGQSVVFGYNHCDVYDDPRYVSWWPTVPDEARIWTPSVLEEIFRGKLRPKVLPQNSFHKFSGEYLGPRSFQNFPTGFLLGFANRDEQSWAAWMTIFPELYKWSEQRVATRWGRFAPTRFCWVVGEKNRPIKTLMWHSFFEKYRDFRWVAETGFAMNVPKWRWGWTSPEKELKIMMIKIWYILYSDV